MSLARFTSIRDEPIATNPGFSSTAAMPAGLTAVAAEAETRDVIATLTADPMPQEDYSLDETLLNAVANAQQARRSSSHNGFHPRKPATLKETGLQRDLVEGLLCRFLLIHGSASGRRLAHATGLAFRIIEPILLDLKNEMLLAYKRNAAAGDYDYMLTDAGTERARRLMNTCTYAETAPVPLADYVASVAEQSLTLQRIGPAQLDEAFADIRLEPSMLDRLGPAINAGRGMFLYGAPGNGKTSVAERVVRCFGDELWIPRALIVDGTVIRLFDPVLHEEISTGEGGVLAEPFEDARWVRVRRPTVVVGGELTMEQLELRHDPVSNVSEAPLQLKSNCGVLLIDDFGRQSMPAAQLLNRWIVPLEKRYDFQKLPTGKKIQVPFDQLVIFSTNLAPRDLVDEAFLRRLPYKIEISDPSADQFQRICRLVAPSIGLQPSQENLDRLIERHFVFAKRPMRCCHPRDLMLQMRSYCGYHGIPLEFSDEAMEFAVNNYFAVL